MDNVELIINQQVADIAVSDTAPVALSYAISDINNIENALDASSKTIVLPGTHRNRIIFGYAEDINVEDFNGQKKQFEAIIKEGGTTVMIGLVNLKKVERKSGTVYFHITITGNSRAWVNVMKEASLQGVDIGGTHTLTKANIEAAEVNNYIYSYGLINTGFMGGNLEIGSVAGWWDGTVWRCRYMIEGTNTIYGYKTSFAIDDMVKGAGFELYEYNVTQRVVDVDETYIDTDKLWVATAKGRLVGVKGHVQITDRPLMWNIWRVLNTIFSNAGYKISSTFINSEFFKNLFLLASSFKHSEQTCLANYMKAGLSTDQVATAYGRIYVYFDTAIEDPGGNFNSGTWRYYAPSPMHVIINVAIRVKQTGTAENTAHIEFRYNDAYPPSGRSVKETGISEDWTVIEAEGEYFMQTGDYVSIDVLFSATLDYTISVEETYFEVNVQQTVVKNTSVVPGDYLPDVPQLDFVRGLKHLFQLNFYTDIHMKTVYIEPRDDFYVRTVIMNLAGKMDLSKPITIEELGSNLSKYLNFQYKADDNDFGASEWERINGATLARHQGEVLNKFAKDGEQAIENPFFSPTLMDSFDHIGLPGATLPKIWGEPAEGETIPAKIEEFLPRILYFAGLQAVTGTDAWNFDTESDKQTYPYFYSFKDAVGNENSLYFNNVGKVRGLFERYWYNYLKTINESRSIDAYMKLSPLDVSHLQILTSGKKDFRALYFLKLNQESVACRLEEIKDYQPGQGLTTKCSFLRDVDRIFSVSNVEVYEMVFTNNLEFGQPRACGGVWQYNTSWTLCREASFGRGVYGGDGRKRGIGSFRVEYNPGEFYYTIERGFFFFDTSAIPDGAVIVEASLFIYKVSGDLSQEIAVYGTSSPITAPLAVRDYDCFGSSAHGASAIAPLGFREIVLNANGLASISKTGWTEFCLRDRLFDAAGTAPTYGYDTFKTYFSGAPAGKVNYLRVRYTL